MNISLTRDSKFELLRIISMLFIVSYHITYYGVSHNPENLELYNKGFIFNKILVNVISPGGQVGVGIFFIMTGYFMGKITIPSFLKKGYKKIFSIVQQMFFYSFCQFFIILVLLLLKCYVNYESFSMTLRSLILTFFTPLSSGLWWFATAYVELIVIVPFINIGLRKLNSKQFLIIIFLVWFFLFSVGYFGSHLFILYKGLFFYLIGMFIREYISVNRALYVKVYMVMASLMTWMMFVFCEILINIVDLSRSFVLVNFLEFLQSVLFVPICATSLFIIVLYFNSFQCSLINFISSHTFGIYLLHDSFLIRMSIWNKVFRVPELYTQKLFPVYLIIIISLVFFLGVLIDMIRVRYFDRYFNYVTVCLIKKLESIK